MGTNYIRRTEENDILHGNIQKEKTSTISVFQIHCESIQSPDNIADPPTSVQFFCKSSNITQPLKKALFYFQRYLTDFTFAR